ncbi:MAG: hypothetical protein HOH43_06940 [Candidatus Latescibacteria bacterium]|nr:hypothetical protein [Candidatus Latescibacterota bacterium]
MRTGARTKRHIHIANEQQGHNMTMDPTSWSSCWLLGSQGLHQSRDGSEWNEVGASGYPVQDLVRETERVLCATLWGLWEVGQAEAPWIQLHDETLTEVQSIVPRPGHPGVAAVSAYGLSFGNKSEHGTTRWISHAEGLTLNERFSNALLALPECEDQWLVGTEQGVLIYDETKDLWHRTELSGHPCRALLFVHDRLWAGTDGNGIWQSTDGHNWSRAGSGLDDESIFALGATQDQILAGSLRGICSGDGTSRWRRSGPALLVSAIGAHPASEGPWLAGATPGGLWRSDDSGARWHQVGDFHTVRVILPPEETA